MSYGKKYCYILERNIAIPEDKTHEAKFFCGIWKGCHKKLSGNQQQLNEAVIPISKLIANASWLTKQSRSLRRSGFFSLNLFLLTNFKIHIKISCSILY